MDFSSANALASSSLTFLFSAKSVLFPTSTRLKFEMSHAFSNSELIKLLKFI